MASMIIVKRLVSSNIFGSTLRRVRPVIVAAPALSRSFTVGVRRRDYDQSDEDESDDDDRGKLYGPDRFDLPFAAADVLSSRARSGNPMLSRIDQFLNNPYVSAYNGAGAGFRRGWDAKETNDAFQLHLEMPGLGKEHVKVTVEQNTLVIRGEGEKLEDEDHRPKYTSRVDLPEKVYKIDGIKAEMKNGVLKVIVPKVKEEERTDIHHVQIQ